MMTRKDDPGADDEALEIAKKQGVPVKSTADVSSDTFVTYGDETIDPADSIDAPPAGRYAEAETPEPETAAEPAPQPERQGRGRHRRK